VGEGVGVGFDAVGKTVALDCSSPPDATGVTDPGLGRWVGPSSGWQPASKAKSRKPMKINRTDILFSFKPSVFKGGLWLRQVIPRIYLGAVVHHFVVQVRARGVAGVANRADHIALVHALTTADIICAQVSV
jgi:hypothetical protein